MGNHPQLKAYVALAAVCFFWGTTYVSIRMALESFPPLFLVAARFVLSGAIMLAVAYVMRARVPRGRELLRTSVNGIIAIGLGNGCLAFAELWIPSGLAALFITISPFWLVGIEAAIPGGAKLHGPTMGGMLIGLAGAGLLLSPTGTTGFSGAVLAGFLVLQLGSFGWSLGSILQKRQAATVHPVVSGAVQQLATGIVFLIPAALTTRDIEPSVRSVLAMLYLVFFGSIVGYSAFIYAMSELPVALVSIYTYINPIVAVWLGWLFYREAFGMREALAMVIIFVGVAIVKRTAKSRPDLRAGAPPEQLRAESAADGRE